MTATRPDTNGKTTTILSTDAQLQLSRHDSGYWCGSDAMFEVVKISDAYFSVTLNVKMICTENYENWLTFVKVMLKILAVLSSVILTNLYFRIFKVVQQRN